MQQHRFAAGWRVFELLLPFPNDHPHVGLRSLELLDLVIECAQLFFRQMEDAMTGSAAIVSDAENLGQFAQRETESYSVLRDLNTLNSGSREDPIATRCPRRSSQNAELLIVADRVGTDACKAGEFPRAQGIVSHSPSINP